MRSPIAIRYRRALVLFVLILLLFSLVASGLLIAQQRSVMLKESRSHAERELRLIAVMVRDALLQRNYATVQDFLNRWAKEDGAVIQLTATSANGFRLVEYTRAKGSIFSFPIQQQVTVGGEPLLQLDVLRDFSAIEESLTRTRIHLLLGTLVFMLLLGRFLWITVQKMALIPMERIESELRKQQYRLRRLTGQKDREIAEAEKQLAVESRLRREYQEISEQRANRLTVLHGLEHGILNADSIESISELALAHIRGYLSCRQALLLLFDDWQKCATLVAESTPDSAVSLPGSTVSIEGYAGLSTLRRGNNYEIADIIDLRSESGLDDLLFDRKMHTYIAIPFIARDRLMGALLVSSDSDISCAGEDLDCAIEIAELITIALQNSRQGSATAIA